MNKAEEEKLIAGDGEVWVCGACGKTSKHRNGDKNSGLWDVSCMLHAVLCKEDSLKFQENSDKVEFAEPVELKEELNKKGE